MGEPLRQEMKTAWEILQSLGDKEIAGVLRPVEESITEQYTIGTRMEVRL